MVDQLSLDLPLALPRLPVALRPMQPHVASEPFDSPDHLFEPTWGGRRVLAFVDAGSRATGDAAHAPGLRLVDDHGADVTAMLPELAGLPARIDAQSAVLDGELVAVDRTGRSDALALAARLRGAPGPSVAFLAFDLVYRDGRPLLGVPLERRREQLRRVLRPGEEAIAVPSIVGEGRALYAAVVEAGIGGVMGRARRSPYLPGIRSRLWQFVPRSDDRRGAAAPTDPTKATDPTNATDDADAGGTARNAPVLALIRRLPLDDLDP